MIKEIFTLLGTLCIIGLILYGSYLFSKYIGSNVMGKGHSKNIKMIDRLMVGQNQSLIIAQVGKSFYLISVTSNEISILKELPQEEVELNDDQAPLSQIPMSDSFKKVLMRMKNKK